MAQTELDASKQALQAEAARVILDTGLAICDESVSTWLIKDGATYCVDGSGLATIEEDFDDVKAAFEYFLQTKDRFAREQ